MSIVRAFKIFILVYLYSLRAFAQTKPLEEVEIDLNGGVFIGSTGIPFDVPFRIAGKATPNLRRVTMKYKIKENEHRLWMRFPKGKKGRYSDEVSWVAIDKPVDGSKFRLLSGPLHPNVTYQFDFTITIKPEISNTERDNLKKNMLIYLEHFLEKLESIDVKKVSKANEDLQAMMQQVVGPRAKIQNLDFTEYILNISEEPLKTQLNEILDINLAINDATQNINASAEWFRNSEFTSLVSKIKEIENGTITLAPASTVIWKGSVNKNLQEFKDITLLALTKVITNPAIDLSDVVKGTQKLTSESLAQVSLPDKGSVILLKDYFSKLQDLKDNNGQTVFTDINLNHLLNAIGTAENTIEEFETLKSAKERKAALLSKFPDVLADKLVSQTYIIFDRSNIDVVSQNTPYIGLDVGFSYLPNYNQVFFYEGVNFYFVPVNKDAPLSAFTGFYNSLTKRLSIHAGLTQNLITAENTRYEPLIKGVGSILVGAGLRFTRIVRVNYGYTFFWEKNINPLIPQRDLRQMKTFSLTFDINIAKALGNFGKRIGLNN